MNFWKACVLVVLVGLLGGCGSDLQSPDNEKVVQGSVVVDFPADLLRQKLMEAETPGIDANTTIFGYKAYRIVYQTTDPMGRELNVSGLMVVPTDYGVREADRLKIDLMYQKGLSIVSDSHGTIFANSEAPTVVAQTTEAPAGSPIILTALAGFVTLQADYVGFGESAGHIHPYLLEDPSAKVTIDFIRAAERFARANDIPLNGQIYLTGYSEGGYVALSALKAMEADGEMVMTAAPMAGPYLLNAMAEGVLSRESLPIPSFMADIAYAYTHRYGLPVTALVREPYASDLPTLLDGSMTREEIDAQLPHEVRELFVDEAITQVLDRNESYWFNQALYGNSPAFWGPKTPVRLVQCLGDDVIPYAMSTMTGALMQERNATDVSVLPVEVIVTGDVNTSVRWGHAACAPYAYSVTAGIFRAVRAATIGY
jgi:hypothetical protein